jgi:hypothetical protein
MRSMVLRSWDSQAIFLIGGILKSRHHSVYFVYEDLEDIITFINNYKIEFCLFSVLSSRILIPFAASLQRIIRSKPDIRSDFP